MKGTLALTSTARNKLGRRASEYVDLYGFASTCGQCLLVADLEVPAGVAKTLTRLYGRPQTVDRGEVAYWTVHP